MAKIGRLELDVVALTAAFQRDLRRAVDSTNTAAAQMGRQTATIQRGFDSAAASLRGLAAGFIGLGTAQHLVVAARNTVAWADSLQELSQRVGIGVEQLQRLQRAGEQTDVTQEQIATNLQAFVRRLGDAAHGSGQFAEVLKRAGVELRNQDGSLRSVNEVFDEYTAAIANASSEQEALSLAVAGFGKSGATFVTTLREMQAGVNEFNVLTGEQVENLAKYDAALTEFAQRANYYLKLGLSELLDLQELRVKTIKTIIQSVLGTVDALADTDFAEAVLGEGRKAAEGMADFEMAVARAGAGLGPLAIDIKDSTGWISGWREQLAEGAADANSLAGATGTLTAAQQRLADAGQVLLRTSAQEERFEAQAEAQAERKAAFALELEMAMAKQAEAAAQAARQVEDLMANALDDIEDPDGEFAAELKRIYG